MTRRIILITGGQRSGKSQYAEQLALSLSETPVYIATAHVWDEEFRQRVAAHQARRGPQWTNIEEERALSHPDVSGRVVLIDCITQQADELFPKYGKYPAATSVHHAFPGGLLNHTWQMLHLLEGIYPVYPYPEDIKVERIIISILFHDWGKLCEYNVEGEKLENGFLLGHIYMSANYLNNLLRKLDIDKREINFIVHCVLAHHGQLEFGSPVLPCIPEAQLLNYIDNISAKADIFTSTGHLEKAFALGTSVVKDQLPNN